MYQGTAPNLNYSPISLLSITSKVLERTTESFGMYLSSSSKSIFLPGKSTVGALLSATQEWFALLDRGLEVVYYST